VEAEADPSYESDLYEEEQEQAGAAVAGASDRADQEVATIFEQEIGEAVRGPEQGDGEAEEEEAEESMMLEYGADTLAELALITNVLSPASPLAARDLRQESDGDSLVFSMSAESI